MRFRPRRARARARPARSVERSQQAGRVGVLRGDRAVPPEAERVGRPDRARAIARAVGQRERGLLVGNRHVGPEKPLRRAREPSAPRARAARAAADSATRPCRAGERGVVDRRREAMGDRPAEDAQAPGTPPPSSSGHVGRARRFRSPPVIGGGVAFELRRAGREDLLAAAVGPGHVVEVADMHRMGGGVDRRDPGV